MSGSRRRLDGTFRGFSPRGLRLLRELEANNTREWFAPRAAFYERELAVPMRALVAELSAAFMRRGIPLVGDPVASIFRLHRDVRFSADKRPYNTTVRAYLSRDGRRATPGGLYIRVGRSQSLLAIAFHRLEAPLLARWRQEMARKPARFVAALRALERRGLRLTAPDEMDDALRRMPRGYESMRDAPLADCFRLRSFSVRRPLSPVELRSAALVTRALEVVHAGRELLEFGWSLEHDDGRR